MAIVYSERCVCRDKLRFPASTASAPLVESHLCGHACRRFVHNRVSSQKKAIRFHVSGLVQGVGYRYFTHRAARQLGVAGYVKNLRDRRVEIYAIGTDEQLLALREDLRQGPSHSAVEKIAETDADLLQEFMSDFSIDYDD